MYKTSHLRFQVVLVLFLGLISLLPQHTFAAATIQVNSNADNTTAADGNCTLREAVANANSDSDTTSGDCVAGSGTDTITFNAAMTITPTSNYVVTSPIIFDASSQATCSTKTLGVVINASSSSSIFNLNAGSNGSTIRGFAITNPSGMGIVITGSSNQTISCNMIGMDQAGMTATGTGSSGGISITNSSGNTIGGAAAGDGNVLSGLESAGLVMTNTTTTNVWGNIIGLDKNGNVATPAQNDGIRIDHGTTIQIGGNTVAKRNIIGGNQGDITSEGILIADTSGVASSNITIQGNYIGTDITGLLARPNTQQSIEICGPASCGGGYPNVTNVTIGGSNAGEGNLMGTSLNSTDGISADGVIGLTIKGNTVGIASNGTTVFASTGIVGMSLSNLDTLIFGGAGANEGNIIANNGAGGVYIDTVTDATIMGNRFNVRADGVTPYAVRGQNGLVVSNATGVTIGGPNPGEENVFADFEASIAIQNVTGILVQGNYIGVGVDGTTDIAGAQSIGIGFIVADGVFGGDTAAEGNYVFNQTAAVVIEDNSHMMAKNNTVAHASGLGFVIEGTPGGNPTVSVLQNTIYDIEFLGINLAYDGNGDLSPDPDAQEAVNINDVGDTDTGANNYINHPIILKTNQYDAATTTVTYMLDLPVSANPYHVEFFTNPSGLTQLGFGDGQTYQDYSNVTISAAGQQIFTRNLNNVQVGDVVTATVTQCLNAGCTLYGGTSEFSNSAPYGADFGTASGSDTNFNTRGAYSVINQTAYMGACENADMGNLATNDSMLIQTGSSVGATPCANDVDGVTLASSYTPSSSITVPVVTSDVGFMNVWIDANQNGTFTDGGEHIVTNQAVVAGTNSVPLTVPSGVGGYSLRFRYTDYDPGAMLPIGEALGGEVEDYMLNVATVSSGGSGGSGGGIVPPSFFTPVTPTTTTITTPVSSGSVSTPSTSTTGLVEALPASQCPVFTGYYKKGMQGAEIKKIQIFLNKEVNAGLPTTGYFGPATFAAVKQFQNKYFSVIILPWVPPEKAEATGYWYKTTRMKANQLSGCPENAVILESNGKRWILPN